MSDPKDRGKRIGENIKRRTEAKARKTAEDAGRFNGSPL